jgi:hypothetical protein
MPNAIRAHESCCRIKTVACPCPVCGTTGRKVTAITLDQHMPKERRHTFGDDAAFCMNPACEVVYFNRDGQTIRQGETVLPATIKDAGNDVYICYCFAFTRADLRKDLSDKGETDIPEKIRQGVKEGRCNCERENPQGACCLGNVADAVKSIQAEMRMR